MWSQLRLLVVPIIRPGEPLIDRAVSQIYSRTHATRQLTFSQIHSDERRFVPIMSGRLAVPACIKWGAARRAKRAPNQIFSPSNERTNERWVGRLLPSFSPSSHRMARRMLACTTKLGVASLRPSIPCCMPEPLSPNVNQASEKKNTPEGANEHRYPGMKIKS